MQPYETVCWCHRYLANCSIQDMRMLALIPNLVQVFYCSNATSSLTEAINWHVVWWVIAVSWSSFPWNDKDYFVASSHKKTNHTFRHGYCHVFLWIRKQGWQIWHPNWVRLAPMGQIWYFLRSVSEISNVLKLILKTPTFVPQCYHRSSLDRYFCKQLCFCGNSVNNGTDLVSICHTLDRKWPENMG